MALLEESGIVFSPAGLLARQDVAETRFAALSVDDPPAIAALNRLHEGAIAVGASDIHFEPHEDGGRVRYRVDGLLRDVTAFKPELFAQIVSRIKVLAAMDIADKRQPQDGRYGIDAVGRSFDARVSSVPTIAGEKLVVRLLDLHQNLPTLETLGMESALLGRFRRLIHAPHGFVVVCGPTGSGKTTTLYASLGERNDRSQHLCSVEDPVEARLPGVAQVQVNARAGLSFESTLRSFLRQDPNVIMVGELRDAPTANVAIAAALSGALVLTSLHSRNACGAIDRLGELGLSRQALAASLTGILAQRLIRRLCTVCKRLSFDEPGTYAPTGCGLCDGSGYLGRIGIYECVEISDDVRAGIAQGASSHTIATIAAKDDHEPMLTAGLRRVTDGSSSRDELRRVLGDVS